MSCRKYFLYSCFIVVIVILYLLYTDQYFSIIQSIPICLESFSFCDTNAHLTSRRIKKVKKIPRIGSNISQPLFQSHIHSYYPHLPIHIYTQNLTALENTTKLILLGNGIFGDKKWGLDGGGRSPGEISQKQTHLMYKSILDF